MKGREIRGSRQNLPFDGERGIFVPLAGVILAGLLSLFVLLVIRASVLREARVTLRSTAENLCEELFPLIKDQTTGNLSGAFEESSINTAVFENPLFEIEEAVIYYPEISSGQDVGDMNSTNACPAAGDVNSSYMTHASEIKKLSLIRSGAGSFTFQEEDILPVEAHARFGEEISLAHRAGSLLGCEIKMRIEMPFSFSSDLAIEKPLVEARTLFRLRVKGPYVASENVWRPPGLMIGVSTQMTTWTPKWPENVYPDPVGAGYSFEHIRNIFTFSEELYSQDFRAHHDPSYVDDGGAALNSFSVQHVPSPQSIAEVDGERLLLPTIPALENDDLLEARTACSNPPVLIRNLLVSTLLELASRDEWLRKRTVFFHLNPAQRVHSISPVSNALGRKTDLVPPTIIARYGEDLAARNFHIPFVSVYHPQQMRGMAPSPNLMLLADRFGPEIEPPTLPEGGVADRLPVNFPSVLLPNANQFAPSWAGWIYPFYQEDDGASAEAWARYQYQIANQLRMCYHLYPKSPIAARRGFFRPPRSVNSDAFWFKYVDHLYYGNAVPDGTDVLGYVGHRGGGEYQPWDQENPWECSPSKFSACPFRDTRPLTAAEVASILGSSQMCPYELPLPEEHTYGSPEYVYHRDGASFLSPQSTCSKRIRSREALAGIIGIPEGADGVNALTGYHNYPQDDFVGDLVAALGFAVAQPESEGSPTFLVDGAVMPGIPKPNISSHASEQAGYLPRLHCYEKGGEDFPLVLVTHTLPTDGSIFKSVKMLLAFDEIASRAEATTERPILIIHIPTHPFDMSIHKASFSTHMFTNQEVLDYPFPPTAPSTDLRGQGSYIMLAPKQCTLNATNTGKRYCSSEEIMEYWAELLNPESPEYIVRYAYKLYHQMLHYTERAL